MYQKLLPFARKLALLSILLGVAYAVLIFLLPDAFVTNAYYALIPFFFLVTLGTRLILLKQEARSGQAFAHGFISTTILRFMLYVGILLLYSFSFPDDAIAFIITFFVFYFVYFLFEVFNLYHNLKN